MNKRLDEIVCRRHALLGKIETQRKALAEISQGLQKPLALVDAGITTVHFIRRHPTLLATSVALFLTLRRGDFTGLRQQVWRLLCLYPATAFLTRTFSSSLRKD